MSATTNRRHVPAPIRCKRVTPFTARWAPSFAQLGDAIHLSWIERDTGNIMLAQTHDLMTFYHEVSLDFPSMTPTALVSGKSGLLLARVDPQTKQVSLTQSIDGLEWSPQTQLDAYTVSAPSLAHFHENFWLLWRQLNDNRLHLMQSADGLDWRDEVIFDAQTESSPWLAVVQDRLTVVWSDSGNGALYLSTIDRRQRRPTMIYSGSLTNYSLCVHNDELYLTLTNHTTGQIRVMHQLNRQEWRCRALLHEPCTSSPTLMSLGNQLVLAWVRDDSLGKIHLALEEDGVIENRHIFFGDIQGHPTVLDLNHHTPYAYLGIIVLPNDMLMPKGQTEAGLIAGLDMAIKQTKAFWREASYGQVDITYEVHPTVVSLPEPMSTYLIRARPKIIDAYGANFPIAFQGGETLELEGSNNYQVTVTFPAGTLSLDAVVNTINDAIKATTFSGAAVEKPMADKNENAQLRIRTTWQVDPGNALRVKGGTAVDLLGLGQNDITVYEGSKKEVEHYDLMVRDALRKMLETKQNPTDFLKQFSGVDVSLASNMGWWALRAQATGQIPAQLAVIENQKPFALHYFVSTKFDAPDVHAHETGHNLGLPDLYEDGWRFAGAEPGLWDVMDSNSFSHPTAWIKSYRSNVNVPQSRWMAESNLAVLDSTKGSIEVLLLPNESHFPDTNPFAALHPGVPICHAIKIALDANHAFFVENRQRGPYKDVNFGDVDYSTYLPGDGLVITDALNDVGVTYLPRSNVVMVHPLGLKIADIPDSIIDEILKATSKSEKQFILAPYVPSEIPQSVADKVVEAKDRQEIEWHIRQWQDYQINSFYPVDKLGEEVVLYQFPDGSGDIRVKILEIIGSTRPYVYKVRATWGRPGSWFDLAISKWKNPPPWESTDIWIDSEENGWDTYEHNDAALNPNIPGNPVLNGDRPWVGHENIVYARVWNHGDIAQNNVRVDFEVVVPPGQTAGIPFATDYIDIPAGGYALAKAKWTPLNVPANEHGCISVKVEYLPWDLNAQIVGELNADNNSAQENISDFYLEKGSPYQDVTLPFEFANPLPEKVEMKLSARGLRPGWMLTVEPYRFFLEPGERIEGEVILHADESVRLEDPKEGYPAPVISLEALIRSSCTWQPIGGFSMIAHTVRQAQLDAGVDITGSGLYVLARARTLDGPVVNANVAARLIGPRGETLVVVRAITDGNGHANKLIPVDWNLYPHGTPISVEVRLSPSKMTGPANVFIPIKW